jgi:hypothetical protein
MKFRKPMINTPHHVLDAENLPHEISNGGNDAKSRKSVIWNLASSRSRWQGPRLEVRESEELTARSHLELRELAQRKMGPASRLPDRQTPKQGLASRFHGVKRSNVALQARFQDGKVHMLCLSIVKRKKQAKTWIL